MRAEEIRELDVDEIRSRIAELEEEQFRLRFRVIRKDIARMKTILRERSLTAGK